MELVYIWLMNGNVVLNACDNYDMNKCDLNYELYESSEKYNMKVMNYSL